MPICPKAASVPLLGLGFARSANPTTVFERRRIRILPIIRLRADNGLGVCTKRKRHNGDRAQENPHPCGFSCDIFAGEECRTLSTVPSTGAGAGSTAGIAGR